MSRNKLTSSWQIINSRVNDEKTSVKNSADIISGANKAIHRYGRNFLLYKLFKQFDGISDRAKKSINIL